MRFYTQQHPHYCGIDLHARTMYLCILNQAGAIVLHRNMKADPESFLKAIAPFRQDIVVAVECIFTGYWIADVCAQEKISRHRSLSQRSGFRLVLSSGEIEERVRRQNLQLQFPIDLKRKHNETSLTQCPDIHAAHINGRRSANTNST